MSAAAWAASVVLTFAIHEAGHYVAARVLGVRTYGLRLNPCGIGLARDFGTPIQNLAITVADPGANFAVMGCLFLTPWVGMFAVWFALMNFVGVAFNLLPFANSDGARAMKLLRLGCNPETRRASA